MSGWRVGVPHCIWPTCLPVSKKLVPLNIDHQITASATPLWRLFLLVAVVQKVPRLSLSFARDCSTCLTVLHHYFCFLSSQLSHPLRWSICRLELWVPWPLVTVLVSLCPRDCCHFLYVSYHQRLDRREAFHSQTMTSTSHPLSLELGSPDQITGCPVKCEFQINSFMYFWMMMATWYLRRDTFK